jgi:hypothetical protein
VIVSINQPAYLPWLGYFDRLAKSDVHVVLDTVQFEKNSMTNRNKIRTAAGWSWLTVPVSTSGKFGELPIAEIETDGKQSWARKHWLSLLSNYARAPHFAAHRGWFEALYQKEWPRLAPLLAETTQYLINAVNVRPKLVMASEMKPEGAKSDLVLNICRALGAATYISGPFGREYLELDRFRDCGIKVLFHDYKHPAYNQCFEGFEPFMSAADLLFNHGPGSRKILETPMDTLADK